MEKFGHLVYIEPFGLNPLKFCKGLPFDRMSLRKEARIFSLHYNL